MERRSGRMFPWRRRLIKVMLALYVVVLLGLLLMMLLEPKEEPKPVYGSLEGRFTSSTVLEKGEQKHFYRGNEITNYLVIGIDRESMQSTGSYQRGGQADFLVVLSIDRVKRTITPVMLDRDTMTTVQTYGVFGHPSGERVMQLCLAYAYSGLEVSNGDNAEQAVETLLQGVRIDRRIELDVSAIRLVNDALGGVEVQLKDDFTVYDPAMTKGATLRLMGDQAEFFVRGRMTVADGTNASRMMRQQQYLSGLLEQFRKAAAENASTASELLNELQGHMSANVRDDILLREINLYGDYEWKPMVTLMGEHAIDQAGFAEFWLNKTALKNMIADIWFTE